MIKFNPYPLKAVSQNPLPICFHYSLLSHALKNQNGVLCVRYTGLKAGTYTFIAKAFREDWPYTQPPAVVDFNIPPPFWTQWRTYLPTVMFVTLEREEAEIKRIRAELDEAQNIHNGLLPTESPDTTGFDIAGMSVLAMQVGGDFYDEEVIQHIVEDVNAFVQEAEQYDDLTLVVVKVYLCLREM